MYLARIILLASGASHQELSYFCAQALPLGAVVRVLVRSKETFGLIIACDPAGDLKQALRASAFAIKKLSAPAPALVLRRSFLRGLFSAAHYEAAPWGALIASFVPTAILKRRTLVPPAPQEDEREGAAAYEPLVFTQSRGERVAEYKRLARESLARGASMLIVAPTIIEAETLAEELRRGIEGYVEVLHGALTEKKTADTWTRIAGSKKPVLIIGTLVALSAPRADIRTLVLERANARSYVREDHPYAHGARVAEEVARALGARFILAATVPSVDAAGRLARGELSDYGISSTRLSGPAPSILDLRAHKKEKGAWRPLMPEALSALTSLKEGRTLILAARRGLAPMTACDDCGTVLSCRRCGRHLVLHADNKREYLCHHCGAKESASVRCAHCSGWRLTTLGIAVDRVAEAVAEACPERPPLVISQDKGTPAERAKALAKWRKEGGILVGTEMVLAHLPDSIDLIVVASIDALLSIPEYTAGERAFTLLCELRARARGAFIVQTRDPGSRVIRALESGMYGGFLKEELADRKAFGYPPETTLIRLTVRASAAAAEKLASEILAALTHLSPIRLEGAPTRRSQTSMHILLRLPRGTWVDQRLLRFIRTLPRTVSARVNPNAVHGD